MYILYHSTYGGYGKEQLTGVRGYFACFGVGAAQVDSDSRRNQNVSFTVCNGKAIEARFDLRLPFSSSTTSIPEG